MLSMILNNKFHFSRRQTALGKPQRSYWEERRCPPGGGTGRQVEPRWRQYTDRWDNIYIYFYTFIRITSRDEPQYILYSIQLQVSTYLCE